MKNLTFLKLKEISLQKEIHFFDIRYFSMMQHLVKIQIVDRSICAFILVIIINACQIIGVSLFVYLLVKDFFLSQKKKLKF